MPENNQMMSVEGQLVGMPLAGPESFSQQQLDYLKRALGVDETVLWEGTSAISGNPTITLSESAQNFKYIDVVSLPHNSNEQAVINRFSANEGITGGTPGTSFTVIGHASGTGVRINNAAIKFDGTSVVFSEQKMFNIIGTQLSTGNCNTVVIRIIGVGRIAGGNQ